MNTVITQPMTIGIIKTMTVMNQAKTQVPMLMVRMRCPECRYDQRLMIPVNLPLPALPEVAKETMRCNCVNHIPKINRNTPLLKSLMSINGVPTRKLFERGLYLNGEETVN